jgi:hypothetical protein
MRALSLRVAIETLLTCCSKEPEYTREQRACIVRQGVQGLLGWQFGDLHHLVQAQGRDLTEGPGAEDVADRGD